MSAYRLTKKASLDLANILLYTTDTWGEEQAERYLSLLAEGFDLIAGKPGVGRECGTLAPRLRRLERGKHVIFYRSASGKVVVSRILHQRMLPRRTNFIDS